MPERILVVRPVPVRYPVTLGYREPANFDPNYIHRGTDFGTGTGVAVVATKGGTVVWAGRNGGYGPAYGIHVVIRVDNIWCIYAHLSEEHVYVGQKISTGQQIGLTGGTGNVTGPHLHYQECTQPPAAYKSDRHPEFIGYAAMPPGPTVFDVSFWGQAWERWFAIPWEQREAEITREIRGSEPGTEASIHGFTEVYDLEQVETLTKALGSDFTRIPGRAGLELWFDHTKWELERAVYRTGTGGYGYPSGIQNRWALVVHLRRRSTGAHVCFVVFHGPIDSDVLKAAYGKWLADLLKSIDGPIWLMGDANRSVEDKSPRSNIRALGFRDFREQAAIKNESAKEFPSKGWDLSDHWTKPDEIDISGGEVDLTPAHASDHRRIEARGLIA